MTQEQRAREHRKILREAARILGETAGEQRESCDIGKLHWACADCQDKATCSSRQRYEQLIASARKVMLVVRRIGK